MQDVEIIGMLKSYVKTTLVGMGALKGAPCQCVIATNQDGTHTVTMKWVDNEGDEHTDSFTVLNGQVGAVEDISDVQVTNIVNGQVLAWDSTAGKWVNVTNSASVASLANIGDVQFTALADGEVLTWDDTAGKWKNKAIPVDNALSNSSENPVQNKVVFAALEDKADKATTLSGYGITNAYTKTETDDAITAEVEKLDVSDSAVAGSYVTAVSEADGKISVTREAADVTPKANSTKMITSGGAKEALDEKQDTLTFDNAPTENSNNPVKSGGVFTADMNEAKTRGALGAKNLLPNLVASDTYNSGTVTKNADGSLTIDGTFDAVTTLNLDYVDAVTNAIFDLSDLIGVPMVASLIDTAVTGITLQVGYFVSGGTRTGLETVSTSSDITFPSGAVKSATYLRIANGTYSDVTVYPMIRYATDIDPTYKPYAKSNKQLTDEQGYFTDDQWAAVTALLT